MKRQLEDHLRKPNTSPNAESSMSCLSCATPPANDWFSEKHLLFIQDQTNRGQHITRAETDVQQSNFYLQLMQLMPLIHHWRCQLIMLHKPQAGHFQYGVGANGWDLEGSPGKGHQVLLPTILTPTRRFPPFNCLSVDIFSLRRFSVEPADGCLPNHINISLFWCSNQTSARHLHHNHMHNCTELLLRYWLTDPCVISYQCEQATEKVPHKMAAEFILTSSVGALVTWCLDLCFMGLRWGQVWRLHYYKTKPQQMILWQ